MRRNACEKWQRRVGRTLRRSAGLGWQKEVGLHYPSFTTMIFEGDRSPNQRSRSHAADWDIHLVKQHSYWAREGSPMARHVTTTLGFLAGPPVKIGGGMENALDERPGQQSQAG